MDRDIIALFKEVKLSATPIRLLVYKSLKESDSPLSLSDVETILETVDKSTISRTLATFKKHHLVHSFSDGSGSVKYEICTSLNDGKHEDSHVHFRCRKCGETICFNEVHIPKVDLPSGYKEEETSYVITGICSLCSGNKTF